MNFKEIKELIKIIDSSNLTEISIEQENLKLTLKKDCASEINATNGISMNRSDYLISEKLAQLAALQAAGSSAVAPVAQLSGTQVAESPAAAVEDNFHYIKSPIVGVFYGSPNPDSPVFVKAGDKISKGQVLCIIEAMKMMNEITSDTDGELVEVLVQNQGTVEYGQVLFKIRKA